MGRRPVNVRSLSLGLFAVAVVCGSAAYNDFALFNTNFVGSFLPLGLMLLAGPFVLMVNGPLARWRPAWAFSRGELGRVAGHGAGRVRRRLGGLMKYLPVLLVAPIHHGQDNPGYRAVLDDLHLPAWVLPTFPPAADTTARRAADPIVAGMYGRRSAGVPWGAWVTPAVTWGAFLLATFGATVSLLAILPPAVDRERATAVPAGQPVRVADRTRPRRAGC